MKTLIFLLVCIFPSCGHREAVILEMEKIAEDVAEVVAKDLSEDLQKIEIGK